jgi:eukaryotic-like serine/threonine-protein kinase
MPLTPGSRFGAYEVIAAIGHGGMGEVFRAHDSTLGRDVALKVLPSHFITDLDRRTRFEREARVLASLNHPNIAAIYGLEDVGGVRGLVLELVEGPTLADRIARGPLPLADALNIGVQIAEALETAHNAGIIHRDLKPANVKVRSDGRVKLLDFGLAKDLDIDSPARFGDSPTVTNGATRPGVVLGTAAYMSPEQARGVPADKRTDVWAFGCVLYEMLTGSRAFGGDSATDTIVSVITEEPKWALLPPDTPAAVRRLLRKCLMKDLRARLRDLGDAQLDLQEALTEPDLPDTATPAASHVRRRMVAAGMTLVAAAGVASGALVWNLMRNVESLPARNERLAITVPPSASALRSGPQAALTAVRGLAISPSGRTVVYVGPAQSPGGSRLYVRSLDAYEPRPLEGTDGASAPFFSPDGQSLAFFAAGKLKRTSLEGGAIATICDAEDDTSGGSSGTWGPDDTIVFAAPTVKRAGLYRVAAYGGTPEVLTTPDPADEGGLGDPAFIPGTDSVMFTTRLTKAGVASSIVVRSLTTGQQRKLTWHATPTSADGQTVRGPAAPLLSRPHYTVTGHLVFRSGSTIMAAAFRRDTLQIDGPVVPVAEDVADFSVSAGGRLVYVSAASYGGQLVWVDRQGTTEPIADPDQKFGRPRLSPNAGQLAVEALRGARSDIAVYRFSSRTMTMLTTDGKSNSPSWHPDGRRIVFRVSDGVAWQSAESSGPPEMLLAASDPAIRSASSLAPGIFSPVDASMFTFVIHGSGGTSADIFRLLLGPDRRIEPLVQRPGNQWAVRVSPDGKWISYASDESGRFEVYLEAAHGSGGKYQVSNGGGSEAVWAPTGKELFYRVEDRMMAVSITNTPDSPVGVPHVLFTGRYQRSDLPQFDVTPDGQRFVMIRPIADELEARTIRIIEGWVDELKARLPVSRSMGRGR